MSNRLQEGAMATLKATNRAGELKEAIRKKRGYSSPAWDYAADKDVDFQQAYENLYERALGAGKVLPVKTRELIAIGILAYRGGEEAVYKHMQRALKNGATIEELYEAIETTIIPGGAPAYSVGLRAIMRIEGEERK
jgi:AhpD family alkylhydroperoxidase